ncbi:hypothetical protein YC2023_052753 [Brassica napus]
MKRDRSDYEDFITHIDMVKTITMLSHSCVVKQIESTGSKTKDNRFECKTCNRKFDSFQALGGHRASHKKPKLVSVEQEQAEHTVHKCSICGQMFGTGQALGGHMRKHRESMINEQSTSPVMNRCNRSKRVMRLDLNLTPLENDLFLQISQVQLQSMIK